MDEVSEPARKTGSPTGSTRWRNTEAEQLAARSVNVAADAAREFVIEYGRVTGRDLSKLAELVQRVAIEAGAREMRTPRRIL